jgi:hypothetical protein
MIEIYGQPCLFSEDVAIRFTKIDWPHQKSHGVYDYSYLSIRFQPISLVRKFPVPYLMEDDENAHKCQLGWIFLVST